MPTGHRRNRQLLIRAFAAVVEVLADDPYHAQTALIDVPLVASVTQLGVRLRVLIPESVADPLVLVDKQLARREVAATSAMVEASLEDVFVAVTMERKDRAA